MSQLVPDEVLLGLLAVEPSHGYQLLEHFRNPAKLGRVWDLSTSQLYAVLKRLERQEKIAGEAVKGSDSPTRILYHLTSTGQIQMEAWLRDPSPLASVRSVRVEFLSRLYIICLLNRPPVPVARSQRASCLELYHQLLAQRDRAPSGVGYLALELQIAQLDAILQWMDHCLFRSLNLEDTDEN